MARPSAPRSVSVTAYSAGSSWLQARTPGSAMGAACHTMQPSSPPAGVRASGASYKTAPPGAVTRQSTVQASAQAGSAQEVLSRGASVPVALSAARPARSHRSSMCVRGFA